MKLTEAEANAMVAEKVFGWKHLKFTRRNNGPSFVMFMKSEDVAIQMERYPDTVEVESGNEENAPDFLRDHAASKMLREKLAENGWEYAVRFSPWSKFSCVLYRCHPSQTRYHFEELGADTEEKAVVLCALKSVGVEAEIV